MFRTILILLALTIFVGCDKAKADLEKCIQLEQQNDPKGALNACKRASKADPNSKSGQAASEKAAQLLPTVIRLEQEKAVAERLERLKTSSPDQKAALEQRMKELRTKVHRSRTYQTEDDHCAGEAKPVHAYRYGGGTFAENETVASGDGCVPFDGFTG